MSSAGSRDPTDSYVLGLVGFGLLVGVGSLVWVTGVGRLLEVYAASTTPVDELLGAVFFVLVGSVLVVGGLGAVVRRAVEAAHYRRERGIGAWDRTGE